MDSSNGSDAFKKLCLVAIYVSGELYIGGSLLSTNKLSDALIESSSIYIGNDPSSTTSSAFYNSALGIQALDNITTGDRNSGIGKWP